MIELITLAIVFGLLMATSLLLYRAGKMSRMNEKIYQQTIADTFNKANFSSSKHIPSMGRLYQYRGLVIKIRPVEKGYTYTIYSNDMKKLIREAASPYSQADTALEDAQDYIDDFAVEINEKHNITILNK